MSDDDDLENFDPALAAAQEARRADVLEEARDWAVLTSTNAGRRAIWNLLAFSGFFRSSYLVGTSREDTWFRDGCRNAGLYVWSKMQQHAPANLKLMLEENLHV